MKDIETCHFWAGRFSTPGQFYDYFIETYNESGDTPISPFAATQNETYYDHDFVEYGYSDCAKSLEELASQYSYADQWLATFAKRINELKLNDINSFVFLTEREISKPESFTLDDGCHLTYIGAISYEI